MCGIIAVIRRPSSADPPSLDHALAVVESVADELTRATAVDPGVLTSLAAQLDEVDRLLRGRSGLVAMLSHPDAPERLERAIAGVNAAIGRLESNVESWPDRSDAELEALNASIIALKDPAWAIAADRVRAARAVLDLMGPDPTPDQLTAGLSMHQALSALDRLEVRGRDSAGLEVIVWGHQLDLTDPLVSEQLARRNDPLFTSGAVRAVGDRLIFVYKAAAEIGELGDNTASLRSEIRTDTLLRKALGGATASVLVLGHTRWASVGIISEPNAHPQSSDEDQPQDAPLVTAVLNGDVDNFADLIAGESLRIPPGITTDAKVIPATMARRLAAGWSPADAFRDTVAALEGSVAIAAHVADEPHRLYLALRGSGQALYVGVADDAYFVASEPYGLVEETDRFLRMDGETPSNPDHPAASRGQVIEIDGLTDEVRRWSYDGTELPVHESDFVRAEITTRDIDRGDAPHFLLKEISDAPASFRKTLRGKLVERDGQLVVSLGESALPATVRAGLADGSLNRVIVIGQGTAAVAGQSLAATLDSLVAETPLRVEAMPATELSGFRLRDEMADTLVVAISQSGTTTDTNRTVDLVRNRGAAVISIVNRRNSDLCDKSDGVLYTSDGRDIEMSVASTKAFYSQVAAGLLLAFAIAEQVPGAARASGREQQELLAALRELPRRMEETLAVRPEIAEIAQRFGPPRRYWAIVGNGVNQIAARELRIKLSELCYKSIACDATEDKKHIDLSSEPMILVCAAGLSGSTAADVGKEIAIYRAHKAAPIAIATTGAREFDAALAVIGVPDTHPQLAFVLTAMAGHLFGYEVALAIDAQARPLREARAAIEQLASRSEPGADLLSQARTLLATPAGVFLDGLRSGAYNGHLEAATAVRIATLFRYATGISDLSGYQSELGKVGTPGVVLDDLTAALTAGIEELTRPIDAIKHQAKTVTVGISRSDESLLQVGLVAATLEAGAPRDRLSYATLKTLGALDAAVAEVTGSTRYRVENAATDDATAVVIDRAGIAANLVSRTERDPRLRGTKHLVAREQELMVALGRSDGRTVIIIPETKDGDTTGLTLLHVRLHDRLPAPTVRGVLQGYRRRYQALRDAVTETEDHFRDDLLAEQPVLDLLCAPILDLADRWRT